MADKAPKKQDTGGLSLAPLTFEEAVAGLLAVKPDPEERRKKKGKSPRPKKADEEPEKG